MKSKPRISVALPVYNHELYLAETLDSILNQTYRDFEIIMIDDGSNDLSPYIANEYATKHPERIHFIARENKGLENTINEIIQLSSGDLVAFTASDDLWYPTKLEKQAKIFDEDVINKIGVVYSYGDYLNEDQSRTRGAAQVYGIRGKIFKELFMNGCFFTPCSVVVRKSALNEVGPYSNDYPYCSDYEIWLRIAAAGYEFDYVPEILATRRIHPNNLSSDQLKSNDNNRKMIIDIVNKHKDLIKLYNLNVDLRLAKFDSDIIRYFFVKNEIRKARKILLKLLFKHPSVFFIGKANSAYFLLSFTPHFILRILKKYKFLSSLFMSK